jgi:hypothetical protein
LSSLHLIETKPNKGEMKRIKTPLIIKIDQDIAFNIPVDLYDECFYVTGILSFWILLPSCVLFVLSSSIDGSPLFSFNGSIEEERTKEEDNRKMERKSQKANPIVHTIPSFSSSDG